jgi:hypothetical protein
LGRGRLVRGEVRVPARGLLLLLLLLVLVESRIELALELLLLQPFPLEPSYQRRFLFARDFFVGALLPGRLWSVPAAQRVGSRRGRGPDAVPAVGRGRGGPRGGHRAGLSVQRRVEPLQRTASPSPSRVRLVEAVQQCGRRGLAHRGGGLLFLTPCHLLEHPGDALVVLVPVRVEVRHGW